MDLFERYFQRNEAFRLAFPENLSLIVTIPVFDDPDIFATVDSLYRCNNREGEIGVVIVSNHAEHCAVEVKNRNIGLAGTLRTFCTRQSSGRPLHIELIEAYDLPSKTAGVGLARKLAMDAAAAYFYRIGKTDCAIASLDADTWVDPSYPDELIRCFRTHPVAGVSIAYAHRFDEPEQASHCDAIIKYEAYLRYYRRALQYTGHPHAYTCIGSAFAVRTVDYVAQGGINKRQAGEDFYFLQKLIATGRYRDLNATKVYPSSRISERTPFGTGQAVRRIIESCGEYPVYHFEAFRGLKHLFGRIDCLYKADRQKVNRYWEIQARPLRGFLTEADFAAIIDEVNANCASGKQFVRRFFDHFNAFRVLKYLNYAHQDHYKKVDIINAVNALFVQLELPLCVSPADMLSKLRNLP